VSRNHEGPAPITREHLQSTHVGSGSAGDRGDRTHLLGSHTLEGMVETATSGTHDGLLGQIRAAEKDQRESLALHAVRQFR
jgi:hypothetical protein